MVRIAYETQRLDCLGLYVRHHSVIRADKPLSDSGLLHMFITGIAVMREMVAHEHSVRIGQSHLHHAIPNSQIVRKVHVDVGTEISQPMSAIQGNVVIF